MSLFVVAVKGKARKVVSKFNDDSLDTAIALGKSVVSHNKVKVQIMLRDGERDKPLMVKQIQKDWRGRARVI